MTLWTTILTFLWCEIENLLSRTCNTNTIDSKWFIDLTKPDSPFRIILCNFQVSLEQLIRLLQDDIFCLWIWHVNNWKTLLLYSNILLIFLTILARFSRGVVKRRSRWTLLIKESNILPLTLGYQGDISLSPIILISLISNNTIIYGIVLMQTIIISVIICWRC